jgi:hypothetical protein
MIAMCDATSAINSDGYSGYLPKQLSKCQMRDSESFVNINRKEWSRTSSCNSTSGTMALSKLINGQRTGKPQNKYRRQAGMHAPDHKYVHSQVADCFSSLARVGGLVKKTLPPSTLPC